MMEWIISSSVLIVVITVLRYVLKGKISLRLQYGLWLLVLLRLLIPMNFFESGLSVMNAAQRLDVVQDVQVLEGIREIEYTDRGNVEGYYTRDIMPDAPTKVVEDVSEQDFARMKTVLSVRPVLDAVWKCGMCAAAWLLVTSNSKFAHGLKVARKELDVPDAAIPVYISDAVETPCLFGLRPPAIYVTPEVAEDAVMLRHVLAHELTHYRHGDHIWSALRGVCLVLHWYNPLVWMAVRLSRRDAELACDEGTLCRIGERERSDYGRTLIGLTCGEDRMSTMLVAATTMTGSRRGIKERIALIARKPRMAVHTLAVVAVAAVAAVVCTFTGAEKPSAFSEWLANVSAEELDTVHASRGYGQEQISYELTGEEKEALVELLHGIGPEELSVNGAQGDVDHFLFVRSGEREFLFQCVDENRTNMIFDSTTGQEFEADGESWCIQSAELVQFVMEQIEKAEATSTIPVILESAQAIPEEVAAYATEYMTGMAESYNRSWEHNNFELRATDAVVELTQVNTGASAENVYILMYEVDFRLRLDGDASRYFGAGMNYEEIDGEYWLMGFSTVGNPYILLACDESSGEPVWERLGMATDEILTEYDTPEMLEKYGNKYTAAAMEYYRQVQGIASADLDRDGKVERIQVLERPDQGNGMYELRVRKLDGTMLWSELAATAHMGWNSLFLCTLDGEDYLLRYNPSMSTGMASYRYTLFTLEGGEETVIQEESIDFDLRYTPDVTPEMTAFAENVNALLEESQLLLSTEGGTAAIGPGSAQPYLERYAEVTDTTEEAAAPL